MTWLRLAFRNVFRQKKRSILLASAIAFGMLAITLLNSLTLAMGTAVKTNFSAALGGHVYISGEVVSPRNYTSNRINEPEFIQQLIADSGFDLVEVKYRSNVRGQVIFGSQSDSISIQGIDLNNETKLAKRIEVRRGDFSQLRQSNTIALPVKQARALGANIGDTVLVKANTTSGQQNLLQWQLVAIIVDQGSFGRSNAYASLSSVNQLINIETNEFQKINLVLSDMNQMQQVTDTLKRQLATLNKAKPEVEESGLFSGMRRMGGTGSTYVDNPWQGTQFEVTNLDDVTQQVMSLVNTLDWIAKAIFVIMLLITLVGISNSYRMVLLERIAEIGNMRAMGAQANNVFRLFIYEAGILAILGTSAGLVVAQISITVIQELTFTGRGPQTMFTVAGSIPASLDLVSVALSSALILIMCLLAAYIPARNAAKLDPAEALRTGT
jgi:putative ABC transport system permease protein